MPDSEAMQWQTANGKFGNALDALVKNEGTLAERLGLAWDRLAIISNPNSQVPTEARAELHRLRELWGEERTVEGLQGIARSLSPEEQHREAERIVRAFANTCRHI